MTLDQGCGADAGKYRGINTAALINNLIFT